MSLRWMALSCSERESELAMGKTSLSGLAMVKNITFRKKTTVLAKKHGDFYTIQVKRRDKNLAHI
jgi:hypothetical protein